MSQYRGKVSGFVPRIESGVFRKRQTLVWNFRLERYTPQGQPLPRVAVELRAKYFRGGAINNGDIVQLSGHKSLNGLVSVRAVKNLTAGTTIRAHQWNASVILLNLVAVLVVSTIIYAIANSLLGGQLPSPEQIIDGIV